MVWYRVRVSESQRHTPTQKYTGCPPPPGSKVTPPFSSPDLRCLVCSCQSLKQSLENCFSYYFMLTDHDLSVIQHSRLASLITRPSFIQCNKGNKGPSVRSTSTSSRTSTNFLNLVRMLSIITFHTHLVPIAPFQLVGNRKE